MDQRIFRLRIWEIVALLSVVFFLASGVDAMRTQGALSEKVVRLHVLANSDAEEDQALKLQVRDAIVNSLRENLEQVSDVDQAREYLQENLPKIESLANRVLEEAGCTDMAKASLAVETFSARVYDTFTLPAGVYDALRVTIGEGEGQNWWCVAFPSLCLPATSEGFEEAASCAGFPDALTAALEGEEGYEIRFYFLDLLGRIENLLHR